jgi:hypothetical protein
LSHGPADLDFGPTKRYFQLMPDTLRRIVTVLLALTFVVGAVPHGMRAADAGVKMIMTDTSDMPMSGMCKGCDADQKAMNSAACSAFCGTFVALPLIGTAFELDSAEPFRAFAGPPVAGHNAPPDPHPPKSSVLI